MESKQSTYKILQLYAKDIYANTRFDEYGNKAESTFDISLTQKGNANALSSYFKGSMNENLDILELFKQYGKTNIVKTIGNENYLTAFVTVVFKGKSTEFSARKDYRDNKLVYIRRGFKNYTEAFENLNDSVYIKNGVVIAVKVDSEIVEENPNVTSLKFFEIEEKGNKKYYSFKNSSSGSVKSIKLREELYEDGFSLNINGEIIKYKRYKRSASNARVGNCLFINEEYFDHMDLWSYFDRDDFKYDPIVESKPVEIEAYKALSLSSLKNQIELEPHNVLILRDEYSKFTDECINVKTDDNGKLIAVKEKTTIKNNIWDGEGLLDVSVFKENGYKNKGMLLLRNKYFKCCAFNTNLQKWFKDNNITSVSQLNGYTMAKSVSDIKLVVTESSMKILKFSDSIRIKEPELKQAIDRIVERVWMDQTGSTFGVVKTDEPTHRFGGRVVSTSYQLLNTLGMDREQVKELIKPSHDYLKEIKNNSSVLRYYLDKEIEQKDDSRFENEDYDFELDADDNEEDILDESENDVDADIIDDSLENIDEKYNNYRYEICSKLLRINPKFEKTKLYSKFRTEILSNIKDNYKIGKLLIPGTFATIFGNGYELLLATINKFDINKTKPVLGKNEVMCKRFAFGKDICAARYPHITMGNLYLATNVERAAYNKYFNLSKEIVCINAINENIQQKLNGMDYDSDTMLITDFEPMVNATMRHYGRFLVPVCSVESQKPKKKQIINRPSYNNISTIDFIGTSIPNIKAENVINNEPKPLYEIDHKIANNYIGRIVNLSQHLNSILWDVYQKDRRIDENLYLNICKLSILSGMEIDKAKRDYNVNSLDEYNTINKMIKESDYKNSPRFREKKEKANNEKYNITKEYMDYETTMDYICKEQFDTGGRKDGKVNLSELLIKIKSNNPTVYNEKAKELEGYMEDTYSKITKLQKQYSITNADAENKRKLSVIKNEKIKAELDAFYKKSYKLIRHPLTIRLLLENCANEMHLWPLLYALYNTDPTDKGKGLFDNLLEELFTTSEAPKRLVEDENGDIVLFGQSYSTK